MHERRLEPGVQLRGNKIWRDETVDKRFRIEWRNIWWQYDANIKSKYTKYSIQFNSILYCRKAQGWSRYKFRRLVIRFFLDSHTGRWSSAGHTQHVSHLMVYCTCPGWLWWWRIWCNKDWQGKPKYSEKTCPSSTLFTTNPTRADPGSNPNVRGVKPATNHLSYGAAKTSN
jgi:hypothetical protein